MFDFTQKGNANIKSKGGFLTMLWTILAVLLVLWVLGLVFNIAGGLIHILLVVAAVIFLFNMLKGRANR
ncbi:hypothetical protein SAMN04488577_2661 [Bacillus sp. cl95]|nr:hypothetical protein SAMN02799634_102541 [Bacillus sp. UNCCL13]SFQ85509.1 hypothetical protein SAMN04488577_2661 [Bacillus sp. cl95]